jgi:hypothetical protein
MRAEYFLAKSLLEAFFRRFLGKTLLYYNNGQASFVFRVKYSNMKITLLRHIKKKREYKP